MDKISKLNSSTTGFTLFELLLIAVLIGIIAAIGLPNWFKFLSEQKLKQANEAIDLTLRTTQNRAKQENQAYTVQFRMNNSVPQISTYRTDQGYPNWSNLLSEANNITLALTQGDSIVFNYDGAISISSPLRTNEKITLRLTNGSSDAQHCVMVQTLLGSLKMGQDTECNQS